jgi:hypothetical protein
MGCEHGKDEDCLICRICGECKEDLDEDDVCCACKEKENKIQSLRYPEKRSVFHHPKTKGEFTNLFNLMTEFKENNDISGVFTTALRLIPIEMVDVCDEHYLIFVWGDTTPSIKGPFDNIGERDNKAKELFKENGIEHGYFCLDITAEGKPEVSAYSNEFFEDVD